ncbi:dihydroorotase [Rhizosphaericola mali]|uniref:Dihydroorotase n=1 Tax=Rhizosphaericola mali TaxID=2545455 RepID=A0A5P2FXK9_9BACT|nr:dihydroorotase [Rhizosphaericola mali]QES88264.1 dihydroorotase [Rhizosphaericola mali]
MSVLFRNVQILDKKSIYFQQYKDILIENGNIVNIADRIENQGNNVEIIEEKDLKVSAGFVDIFSHFNDPGLEQKETLETGAAAAAAGGYTQVFVLPNTKPVIDNKSFVEYIRNKSAYLPINILPLGGATKQIEGKEIGEMFDMFQSGAIAFTDGLKPVQSSGLFLKILQYVKSFDGILIQQPFETSIGAHGLMNEGIISTQLGLPGLPAISEEIFIQRDIELLKYTESKLHITGVSTKRGAEMILQAKSEGLNITFSVTPHHLMYCDEEVTSYDSNYKFNPPLRTKEDRDALRALVLENKVDAIASHHFPQHWDDKTIEFEYAKNGVISLQTAFAAVHTAIPELSGEQLADLFANNVRAIFKLENADIEIGKKAEFTIFNLEGKTILTKENNKSKSANSSFLDKELKGNIFGIFAKGKLVKN